MTSAEVERFVPLAYGVASRYFLATGNYEDVRQEALIGVWKGLRDHDPSKGPLEEFVFLCVRRNVLAAVKRENKLHARFLTHADRVWLVEQADGSADYVDISEVAVDPRADVEHAAEYRATLRDMLDRLEGLTELERRCLIGVWFQGRTYEELGRPRSVDNAVQRARRKVLAA